MRRTILFAALLSLELALPLVSSAAPHAFTIDDMLRFGRVADPQLGTDGKTLYFAVSKTRLSENRWQSAVSVQRLDGMTGSGEVSRLTFPERGAKQEGQDINPHLSPDGRWLAFLSTRDGGAPQLYVMRAAGGEARRLTHIPSGVQSLTFSPDSRAIVVQARVYADCPPFPAGEECNKTRLEVSEKQPIKGRVIDRLFYRWWDSWYDGQRNHILRVLVPSGDEQVAPVVDLTPGDFDTPPISRVGARPIAFSPDGRELAFVQNRDKEPALSTNHDLMTLPLSADYTTAGPSRPVTSANPAADVAPRYSPDGRYLAYLAQRRPGFEADRFEIWLRDRKSDKARSLTASFDATISDVEWAPDSKRLYFVSGKKGRDVLYSMDLSGEATPTELSAGECGDLHVYPSRNGSGATLIFLRSSLYRPAEVYRLEVAADGRARGKAEVLTHINDAALAEVKLGQVSELYADSQDGLKLHSHLVLPADFVRTKRYPAVVLLHGGPQGAWEDMWQWRWNAQAFAGAGYVVMMPNPRGSEGFGQRFVDEVSGDWGGRAYDDVMRLVDKLVAEPYVDAKRVAAAGASYGGYLVDWIAGHSDRFAALVSHAGVYDLRSMYGETEEMWFPRWEFKGDPWSSDQYDKWSPSRFVDRIKTPMLVIANERDFRVPVGQGMQLFTALQIRKVPSRMLIFPDENHWVLRPSNARLWYAVVIDWLHRYIGGAPADPKALESAACYAR